MCANRRRTNNICALGICALVALGGAVTAAESDDLLVSVADLEATAVAAPAAGESSPGCSGQPCSRRFYDACTDGRCGPAFFVRTEALWLEHDRPRGVALAEDSGEVVLSTSDADFDMVAGPRLTIGKRLGCDWTAEISYFGTHHWAESAHVTRPGESLGPAGPLGEWITVEGAFTIAGQYNFTLASEIHNAEINFSRKLTDYLWVLGGVRYVNLNEKFDMVVLDSLPPFNSGQIGTVKIRVDNDLIGAQLGLSLDRPLTQRFSVLATGKAGIYGNVADSSVQIIDPQQTINGLDAADSTGHAAGVFEIGAAVNYQLTSCIRVTGGYNMLWLTGVALAGDQEALPYADFDSLFLHGPSVGFEWRR